MSTGEVHGAQANVHYHPHGRAAVEAATERARNTSIVIGADQSHGALLLDIDVQADVCANVAELRSQLRLVVEALKGQDPLASHEREATPTEGPTIEDVLAGAGLIAAERRRQVEAEGWTAEHDATHGAPALLRAAEAYERGDYSRWPWDAEWWKPKDALSDLIRAGALYRAAADLGGYTAAADAGVARCAAKIDALAARVAEAIRAEGAR